MRNFRVAIYGTAASYHDLAARKFYGHEVDLVECSTFRLCCEMLQGNEADYAVMAIENSLAGSILSNYSLVSEYGFRIIGEQFLRIELDLLALPGTVIEEIGQIHSHPMALAQCSEFLAKHPAIKIVEMGDTAGCAREIATKQLKDVAAIGNRVSAEKYGLSVLKENVENHTANFTRFIVLSKGDAIPAFPNKASFCFRLKHEVGALGDVLKSISRNGVTLSKIQSVPVAGEPREYIFHTDVEWEDYKRYRKVLKAVEKRTSKFHVLGEYVKANLN